MTDSKLETEKGNRRPWYNWVLLSTVVLAVVFYVWSSLDEIKSCTFSFNWIVLLLSFIAIILAYLVSFVIWTNLIASFGIVAPVMESGKGWFLSQLGKYVPGKVGLLLVRLVAYRDHPRRVVAIATGVEFIAVLAAACLLVLIGVAFSPINLPSYIRLSALVGSILCLLALQPRLMMKAVNFLSKIMRREPLEQFPSYRLILRFVFAYTLQGMLYGLGFYLVLNSFSNVSIEYYLTITATVYAAVIVGMAAVFAPSGIGVREGVLFLILPALISKPDAILGAIITRLLATAAEVLLAGMFFSLAKIFQNK